MAEFKVQPRLRFKKEPELREILGILGLGAEIIFENSYYGVAIIGKRRSLLAKSGPTLIDLPIYGCGMTVWKAFTDAVNNVKMYQEAFRLEKLLNETGKEVIFPEFQTLEELRLKLLVGTI